MKQLSLTLALLIALTILFPATALGITEEKVTYQQGNTTLEGFIYYKGRRNVTHNKPAVLVVHQWMGISEYEKRRAKKLARMGYVAFCVDIYGKGVRAKNWKEASKLAAKYRKDRPLLRKRITAGLDFIRKHKHVDSKKVAAIGFCFGGGTVLELARSGADIKGVVSFHGNLDTPNPADGKNIKAKVLVLHGAIDPVVPDSQVKAFHKEMKDADVDWFMHSYGGAVHAFTHFGTNRYHKQADRRSWHAFKWFLREGF